MRIIWRVGLGLLVVGTLTATGVSRGSAADEGAKIFADQCARCHTVEVLRDKLKGKQPSRQEWIEILDRMKGLGAEVPRGKQDMLLNFLLQTFGEASGAAK